MTILSRKLAEKLEITYKEAKQLEKDFCEVLSKELAETGIVRLREFASFKLERTTRTSYFSIQTGKNEPCELRNKVRPTFSSILRKLIN